MANVTLTTSAVNKRSMLAEGILASLERQLIFEQTVDSSYNDLITGGQGQVLTIPKFTEPTVGTKSAGSDVSFSADTHGSITLTMNQHKFVAKQIESIAQLQTQESMFNKEVEQFGYALSKSYDTFIMGTLEGASNQQIDYSADDTFTIALIREGVAKLLASDCPLGADTFLVANPQAYSSLLSLDNFVDASKYGDSRPVRTGEIGTIFGLNVFVSSAISGQADGDESAFMYHRTACIAGRQLAPTVEQDYSVTALADRVVAHMVFGAVVAFDTRLVEYNNV